MTDQPAAAAAEPQAGPSTFAEKHVQRTLDLLAHERDVDLEQTSLLASKCSPKLLEQRGLAILNLQVANLSIGLGGKTLVELERWMKGPLPAHSFRNGDTCEILAGTSSSDNVSKSTKGKGKEADASNKLQGIVYRTHEDRVIVALDSKEKDDKDFDIPQKCRLCVYASRARNRNACSSARSTKAKACEYSHLRSYGEDPPAPAQASLSCFSYSFQSCPSPVRPEEACLHRYASR